MIGNTGDLSDKKLSKYVWSIRYRYEMNAYSAETAWGDTDDTVKDFWKQI